MRPQIDVVGLIVRDLDASVAFYRQLGLELPEEIPDEARAHGHLEWTLPGGLRLTWDTIDSIGSFDRDWTEPSGSPRMALAFLLEAPAEVDRLYGELVGAGYSGYKQPWDAFWGQRYAMLRDPDGNGVDLFSPLSRS